MSPKGEETKEKILVGARTCLLTEGAAETSVKAIARTAGVNHGLVHHYFESKADLMLAVMKRERETLEERLLPSLTESLESKKVPPADLLGPEGIRLIIEFLAMADTVPGIAEQVEEIFNHRVELFSSLLSVEKEQAMVITGGIIGLTIMHSIVPTLPIEKAVKALFTAIKKP